MDDEPLKGRITIGRYMSNRDLNRPIYIEVEDESSRVPVVKVYLGPEELALALTGLSRQPCEYEPPRAPHILGARHEFKQVEVRLPDRIRLKATDPDVRAALAEHEVDGWRADTGQVDNPHYGPASARSIFYRRYVDAGGNPIEVER